MLLASSLFAQSQPKTRNVVLIVADGLRWQEVFTGADPSLLNSENGGIWGNPERLKREFWRDDSNDRRRTLFPFLWGIAATQGQIIGNQAKGSIARVTNGKAFSFPGYNEMLTGSLDPKIDSNEFGPNPNATVFEWLNRSPNSTTKSPSSPLGARSRIFSTPAAAISPSRSAGTCPIAELPPRSNN